MPEKASKPVAPEQVVKVTFNTGSNYCFASTSEIYLVYHNGLIG